MYAYLMPPYEPIASTRQPFTISLLQKKPLFSPNLWPQMNQSFHIYWILNNASAIFSFEPIHKPYFQSKKSSQNENEFWISESIAMGDYLI